MDAKTHKAAARLAWHAWHEDPLPEGTIVEVTRDDLRTEYRRTRSAPWLVSGHPLILLSGIAGGYDLTRVRRLRPDEMATTVLL